MKADLIKIWVLQAAKFVWFVVFLNSFLPNSKRLQTADIYKAELKWLIKYDFEIGI